MCAPFHCFLWPLRSFRDVDGHDGDAGWSEVVRHLSWRRAWLKPGSDTTAHIARLTSTPELVRIMLWAWWLQLHGTHGSQLMWTCICENLWGLLRNCREEYLQKGLKEAFEEEGQDDDDNAQPEAGLLHAGSREVDAEQDLPEHLRVRPDGT